MDLIVPAKPFDPKNATEEEILARVLHRDGLMLVIDKPAGLSVHRGPKGGPSLEDWFDSLRYGLPRRPALAHRLDRETSGCLVLGRHRKALAHLSLLFKHRRVGKTYWAVVEGGPAEDEGTIDMPLGKLDPEFGWWMKPDPHGQPAVTKWKVMGRAADRGITWLALEPVTGRTHQLRVHCAAMGFPIFGDDIYGNEASQRRARQIKFVPRPDAPGLQLHAREVVVPISQEQGAGARRSRRCRRICARGSRRAAGTATRRGILWAKPSASSSPSSRARSAARPPR